MQITKNCHITGILHSLFSFVIFGKNTRNGLFELVILIMHENRFFVKHNFPEIFPYLEKKGDHAMKHDQLWEDIRRTMEAMDNAQNNFDHVTDPALIDYYSYTLKAASIRYQFLLRQAKCLDLTPGSW